VSAPRCPDCQGPPLSPPGARHQCDTCGGWGFLAGKWAPEASELLTEAEHDLIKLLGACASLFSTNVVGDGPTRAHDVDEFCSRVHDLQARVMAQAAGRAYPDRYRLAGGTLRQKERFT